MWAISGQAATSAAVSGRGSVVVVGRQGRAAAGRGGVVQGLVRRSSGSKPVVQRLSKVELPRLLPWSGCGERLAVEVGDLEACMARVAVSLVACALVYNTSIELASVAGFYWAWAPIVSTALPSMLLRLRYGYAGIWSAQVLNVQILYPPKFTPDDRGDLLGKIFNRLPMVPSTLHLEIGDGSPATFSMEVPLSDDVPEVEAGDRVELVVVSDEPFFSRFKALRDVYLPERRAWISVEPSIEREPFEKLQRSLNPSLQSSGRKQRIGRRTQLLLGEKTLSRNTADWKKSVRDSGQSSTSRELGYIRDVQQFSSPRKLDSMKDMQEEKKNNRRPTKELNDDDLYW